MDEIPHCVMDDIITWCQVERSSNLLLYSVL